MVVFSDVMEADDEGAWVGVRLGVWHVRLSELLVMWATRHDDTGTDAAGQQCTQISCMRISNNS